jgi:hypothetical protein
MPPEALAAAFNTTFTAAELHQHWRAFTEWAIATGVSLADAGDYLPWWECYICGAYVENQRL